MKLRFLFLLQIFYVVITSAQTIPASRTSDWSYTGYPGIIPNPANVVDVTTFGAIGDGVTDNYTFIQNAITSLNGRQGVVYFPPGNYLIGSTLNLPDSVILRGASSDSTHLSFNMNGAVGNCVNITGSSSANGIRVIAGAMRGSQSIVVDNTSTLFPGDYLELEENNGSWDTQPVSWADNSVGQILHIVSIDSDTIVFDRPLRINYDTLLNVRLIRMLPRHEVGIECLQISRDDSVHTGVCINIYFNYAVNCWIRGVESSRSIGSHFEADASANISITGCYVHHNYEYDGTSTHGYGITLFKHTVQCKVENNIMKHLRHCYSLQCGSNGNVVAYNYSLDPNRSEFPPNYGADISMHGHYTFANLFEGNIVQNLQIDQTWGPTGPYNTFFRNRVELYGILMTSGTVQSDSQNFVGNEISNTGLFMGMYTLYGVGHFEFGNNVRGTITPPGTLPLNDSSYYLSSVPSFWSGSAWPSIGMPNAMGSGSIPAKDRYDSGQYLTVCDGQLPTGLPALFMQRDVICIFPNPFSSDLHIRIDQPSPSFGKFSIETMTGETILEKPAIFRAGENLIDLIDTKKLSKGVYLLKITAGDEVLAKKIIRE